MFDTFFGGGEANTLYIHTYSPFFDAHMVYARMQMHMAISLWTGVGRSWLPFAEWVSPRKA